MWLAHTRISMASRLSRSYVHLLQCTAVYCSVLQYVVASCSALQCTSRLSRSYMWRVWVTSHIYVMCIIFLCAVTHFYKWHYSLCVAWHVHTLRAGTAEIVHVCAATHFTLECQSPYTGIVHMCDMCVPRHTHEHFVTSHTCVTWLISQCDVTHSCMCQYSWLICVTWLTSHWNFCHITLESLICATCVSDIAYVYVYVYLYLYIYIYI